MRMHRLLMPAVTLAGALALAGCGGGSDSPMKKDPGGDECDYGEKDDGSCYTLAERDAKRDAERDKKAEDEKKTEEMSEAAQARAKALHGLLTAVDSSNDYHVVARHGRSFASPIGLGGLTALYDDAVKAPGTTGAKNKASVSVMNTKGPDVESVHHAEVSDTATPPGDRDLKNPSNARHIIGSGFANDEGVMSVSRDLWFGVFCEAPLILCRRPLSVFVFPAAFG